MSGNLTIDTNILVYAFAKQDDRRKQIAKDILLKCNMVSLQVVNETMYVLWKKFSFSYTELTNLVTFIKQKFTLKSLSIFTLEKTISISKKYGFSFWDSMIIASALENNCKSLFSEDLQHGQIIDSTLKIINPFI